VQYNVPYGWQFKGARLMAVFPHGSARGGSRSDGPQQIKDLRADDFYGDSHDGNDGSRGSHDTTRNTRTYTLPTFAEATDASEAMRERRADRNKSIAMRVLAAVLILTALGIGMFPRVLQYRSARELASTSARSEKRVAGWPYPQADEAFAAAREYNKRLAKSGQPVIGEAKDPLAELYDDPQNAANNASADGSDNSGDSASAKDKEYQSLLDSGDGVMGAIRIPKISVNLPVYHGTSELTLASGAGHLYGSSLPVGGKSTHSVITGHRGLVEAAMFTRLDEMRVGDYFYLDVMGRTLGYKVDRITEINPDDTSKLKIVPGEDRVTLMTCTPYGVNTHRLLVSALRSAIPEEIPAEDDAAKDVRVIAGVVSAATLLVGLLLVWLLRCPWHVRRHAAWWPKRN
jgi:sortase A